MINQKLCHLSKFKNIKLQKSETTGQTQLRWSIIAVDAGYFFNIIDAW